MIWLLSQEFTKAVLIANVVAWPVAYVVMNGWLQSFAYRTPIHLGIFFLAAGLALIIALLTLSLRLFMRPAPIPSIASATNSHPTSPTHHTLEGIINLMGPVLFFSNPLLFIYCHWPVPYC